MKLIRTSDGEYINTDYVVSYYIWDAADGRAKIVANFYNRKTQPLTGEFKSKTDAQAYLDYMMECLLNFAYGEYFKIDVEKWYKDKELSRYCE